MKPTTFLLFGFLLLAFKVAAQSYSGKLIDAKTKNPIPYATIQYNINEGVVTNEEGNFSFSLASNSKLDSIYISSMGYEKTGFSFSQFNDSIIALKPKAINLSGVYVFDKNLEVDEIIEKTIENLEKNHSPTTTKKRFFLRQSDHTVMQKVTVDFEKSTIAEINKAFIDSAISTFPRKYAYYTETLGDYYQKKDDDFSAKLEVVKAAELYDKSQEISFESFGERMEEILEKRLKKDSYLKIKSGWFGTKVQVDSIFEASDTTNTEERVTDTYLLDNRKQNLKNLHERLFSKDYALDVLQKHKRYDFEIVGFTDIEDLGVYVIDFKSKGKGEFNGTLYINVDDFGVVRIDYENIKSVKKFKLLGFSFNQHTYNGSMVYTKTPSGTYTLKFARHNNGSKFGVDRPLKIVEKNKFVKGRRKQNELKLNLDIIQTQYSTNELVVFAVENSNLELYNGVIEDKNLEAVYLPAYDPNFWSGYNIIEPNQAIKEFTIEDAE